MKKLVCVVLAVTVVCLALAVIDNSAVAANTYNVPDDYSTIQGAINAAIDGDTVLVADGTYYEHDLDLGGKAITVKSENGAGSCIIDCEDDGRGFYFHNNESADSIVEGFTIKNGYIFADIGGGIYCEHTSPTISHCIIKDCEASSGAGIACQGQFMNTSTPKIMNCLITDNAVNIGVGGGIRLCYSDATIVNCTITDNNASTGGGGLYCQQSHPEMTNTILWGNESTSGGAELGTDYWSNVTVTYSDIRKSEMSGNWTDSQTNIDSDPLFVGNGDYHIKAGSPCIDAGNNTVVTWEFDVAGNWRIIHGTVEIGAYEYGIFRDTAEDRGRLKALKMLCGLTSMETITPTCMSQAAPAAISFT
jgi:hypothetical protein